MEKNKKALVIDGNSLMYRMFYATKNMAEYAIKNNLQPINAAKLMLETCLKLRSGNYDYCLVAFDYGRKTFRHNQLENYKDGRKKMPEELVGQIKIIKHGLELIGFNHLAIENYEADDIIGTYCQKMNEKQINVDVYTSDKDMLQLVNKYTNVSLIKTGLTNVVINTIDNFANLNNGLSPKQIIDYKAIVGDKSDNIAGIKGVGEKIGISLILRYETLENIYQNLDDLGENLKQKFSENRASAEMFKNIVTIKQDLDNEIFDDLNNFQLKPIQNNNFGLFLEKYKINNLKKYIVNEQIGLF